MRGLAHGEMIKEKDSLMYDLFFLRILQNSTDLKYFK